MGHRSPAPLSRTRRLRRLLADERGHALTEMLGAVGLLAAVLGGSAVALVATTNAQADLSSRVQSQAEARLALDQLRRETRCAQGVTLDPPTAAVTFTFGAHCRPGGTAPYTVTWCTSGSGTRWALRRVEGTHAVCPSAGGRLVADHLTRPHVFLFAPPTAASRAILSVDLRVDVDPEDGLRVYHLRGDVVLRNTRRAAPTG